MSIEHKLSLSLDELAKLNRAENQRGGKQSAASSADASLAARPKAAAASKGKVVAKSLPQSRQQSAPYSVNTARERGSKRDTNSPWSHDRFVDSDSQAQQGSSAAKGNTRRRAGRGAAAAALPSPLAAQAYQYPVQAGSLGGMLPNQNAGMFVTATGVYPFVHPAAFPFLGGAPHPSQFFAAAGSPFAPSVVPSAAAAAVPPAPQHHPNPNSIMKINQIIASSATTPKPAPKGKPARS